MIKIHMIKTLNINNIINLIFWKKLYQLIVMLKVK